MIELFLIHQSLIYLQLKILRGRDKQFINNDNSVAIKFHSHIECWLQIWRN